MCAENSNSSNDVRISKATAMLLVCPIIISKKSIKSAYVMSVVISIIGAVRNCLIVNILS